MTWRKWHAPVGGRLSLAPWEKLRRFLLGSDGLALLVAVVVVAVLVVVVLAVAVLAAAGVDGVASVVVMGMALG